MPKGSRLAALIHSHVESCDSVACAEVPAAVAEYDSVGLDDVSLRRSDIVHSSVERDGSSRRRVHVFLRRSATVQSSEGRDEPSQREVGDLVINCL
jgi:hypothetical protein